MKKFKLILTYICQTCGYTLIKPKGSYLVPTCLVSECHEMELRKVEEVQNV